jgi:hypothetical protein
VVLTTVVMDSYVFWNGECRAVRGKSTDISKKHVATETSIDFQRATWRYIPAAGNLDDLDILRYHFGQHFSLLHSVLTVSGVHPSSYLMNIRAIPKG